MDGHRRNNKKFHPTKKDDVVIIGNKKSRGANSFKNGKAYQHSTAEMLTKTSIDGKLCTVKEVSGSESGPDIIVEATICGDIGIEVKDEGAFEGGSSKMEYDYKLKRLTFPHSKLHQRCLGDEILYGGKNLPWYEGNCNEKLSDEFKNDIRRELPTNTMSEYYKDKGVYYIQVQGYGLYHTGEDILNLGVPFFECHQYLRIRTSKHKKKLPNGVRIPTDVVGDINYNKRTLKRSAYNLDGNLPPSMRREGGE